MSYSVTMTKELAATLEFVGGRYAWADAFPASGAEIGETVTIPEHEAWIWHDAVDSDSDSEGGHHIFPLLDMSSPTGRTLLALYDAIV